MSLSALSFSQGDVRRIDVLVVGLGPDGVRGVPEAQEAAYAKQFGTSIAEMAAALGAKSAAGSRRTLPAAGQGPRIIVVGLGDGQPGTDDLRRAAAAGTRAADALGRETPVAVAVSLGSGSIEQTRAVAEGALLGPYSFQPVTAADAKTSGIASVVVIGDGVGRGDDLATEVTLTVEAVIRARDWVNAPANLLYPQTLAEQAGDLVKGSAVAVEILDEKALTRGGYGGLLAVGGGSQRPPRLVRLAYRPRGAKTHLALIGKGITFDTGGLNLKPADGMYTMKSDMAGAAAVIAAVNAIARLGLKISVTGYAALAENMPSGSAYRPSDVITQYGGKTVENGNSDAEGRIVMADALVRAGEDKPNWIIDVATLTGACMVALGDRTAGLLGNDDELADQILDAAESAGEPFWQLPIPSEIRPKLDSKVADLRSVSKDRYGGALVAAAFLREFIPEGTPWAHCDIAGPAFHDGAPYGYVSSGGTGFGVRTLIALARSLSA